MSGHSIRVCGVSTDFLTPHPSDPSICAVFYEVAGHISDARVRSSLQAILGLGDPSKLPPVETKQGGDEFDHEYTISTDQVKIYLPMSDDAFSIPFVLDSAICLALNTYSADLADPQLRSAVSSAATLGLQVVAQQLAQAASSMTGSGLTTA